MVEWNEDGSIPPAAVLWVVSACEKKLIEKKCLNLMEA